MSSFDSEHDSRMIFAKRYAEFLKSDQIIDYIMNFVFLDDMKEKAIRVNTLKISLDEFIEVSKKAKIQLQSIDWLDFGFYAKAHFSLGSSIEYLQGLYYIQSIPSQFVVQVLNPTPNSIVLDMASSPGGKTSLIAQYMKNSGLLIALEKYSHRFESLKANLQRLDVRNTIVLHGDATNFKIDKKFDYILIDAPCSGNFFSDRDWFRNRKLSDFVKKSKTQLKMLLNGYSLLKSKGIMVYSTCSLEPEEDEFVVDKFLELTDAKLLPIEHPLPNTNALFFEEIKHKEITSYCVRFWPHLHNVEGFFIAKFQKP